MLAVTARCLPARNVDCDKGPLLALDGFGPSRRSNSHRFAQDWKQDQRYIRPLPTKRSDCLRDGQERTRGPTGPFHECNPLVFKTLARVLSPLVEHLRSKVAKLWVQSPRLFQEQARIGRNRLLPGEQVFKGRNLGTIGIVKLQTKLEKSGR
jgi:hypothetical protein